MLNPVVLIVAAVLAFGMSVLLGFRNVRFHTLFSIEAIQLQEEAHRRVEKVAIVFGILGVLLLVGAVVVAALSVGA